MPDPRKKITQARVAMMFDQPFFGHLAIGLEVTEKKNMPMATMATDGRHLFYDPKFVTETPLDELAGVIAHEVMHCALNHLSRRQGRDERWNLAADFAVNDAIQHDFPLPGMPLVPGKTPGTDDFIGRSSDYIYSKLLEPIYINVTYVPMDSHVEWDDWGKNGKDKGKGDKDKDEKGDGKSGASEPSLDGNDGGGDDEEEIDDLEQQWRERVAQATTIARMQGKLPAHIEELVGGILQPKLIWKHILQEMIVSCAKSDFRILPPNKRYLWMPLYLPSVKGEEINIAVCIDSSGSISNDQLCEFLSEVKGICEQYSNYTIYLMTCDAQIHQRWELHEYDPIPFEKMTIQGRGGTSFVPPIEAAEKECLPISSFVYLTDMAGTFPDKEPSFPVIWISTEEGAKPPFGFVIHYPKD